MHNNNQDQGIVITVENNNVAIVPQKTGLQIFREFAQVLSKYALGDASVTLDKTDKEHHLILSKAVPRIEKIQKTYQEALETVGDDPHQEFLACAAFIGEFLRNRYEAIVTELDQFAGTGVVGVISTPIFVKNNFRAPERQLEIYEHNDGKNILCAGTTNGDVIHLIELQRHMAKFYTEIQQYMQAEAVPGEELSNEIRGWIATNIGSAGSTIANHINACDKYAPAITSAENAPNISNNRRSDCADSAVGLGFGFALMGIGAWGVSSAEAKSDDSEDHSDYTFQFGAAIVMGVLFTLCGLASLYRRYTENNAGVQQAVVANPVVPAYATRTTNIQDVEGQPLLGVGENNRNNTTYGATS